MIWTKFDKIKKDRDKLHALLEKTENLIVDCKNECLLEILYIMDFYELDIEDLNSIWGDRKNLLLNYDGSILNYKKNLPNLKRKYTSGVKKRVLSLFDVKECLSVSEIMDIIGLEYERASVYATLGVLVKSNILQRVSEGVYCKK